MMDLRDFPRRAPPRQPEEGTTVLEASKVAAPPASFCNPTPQWPRSFAEEFDGKDLNTSTWDVYLDNSDGQCGFGIGRYGRCDASNVYLQDGSLVLRSDRKHSCNAKEGCFNYSSAGITTRDKATWSVANGAGFRLCVSAILPGGSAAGGGGAGIWPAHWMMPNDRSCDPDEGEIDVLEMINGNGNACGTYHWQTTWPAKNCSYPVGHESVHKCSVLPSDWGSTYHEFAVEHTADYLAFVVDGVVQTNTSKDSAEQPLYWDIPFFLILNTAIGGKGTWASAPNAETKFPTYHKIDYVRSNSMAKTSTEK